MKAIENCSVSEDHTERSEIESDRHASPIVELISNSPEATMPKRQQTQSTSNDEIGDGPHRYFIRVELNDFKI